MFCKIKKKSRINPIFTHWFRKLDMKTPKIWFSLLERYEYLGDGPAIYPKNSFEWEKLFEGKHELIFSELQNYINTISQPTSYFNYEMVNKHGAWKTIPLMSWGVHFHKHKRHFPETYKLVKQIPNLVSLSFNVLEPKSNIKPHFGDTNAMVRCHYGLQVSGELPDIGFRVKDEQQAWKEGELLIFCDGYVHEAWNNTDKQRIIMLFDVILPEYKSKKRRICGTVLSSIFFQSMLLRLKLKEPPKPILRLMTFFAKYSAIALTPIYNFVGKIRHK